MRYFIYLPICFLLLFFPFASALAAEAGAPAAQAPSLAAGSTATAAQGTSQVVENKTADKGPSQATENKTTAAYVPLSNGALLAIIVATYVLVLIAIKQIFNGLRDAKWSIAGALSENETTDVPDPNNPAGTIKGQAQSSSRLIAFLGMIVILFMFLGIGAVVIWDFGKTGSVPDLGSLTTFLFGGAGLFAPYAFNQLKDVFNAFGKTGS